MTFAADLEREKARQRVHDAMSRKARAGHVTGGKTFGYDNVAVTDASGKRSHVERRVNDAEAVIVRRIFDLCAAGTGYTRITKLLNAEHAPAPRPKCGRPTAWAPSSVKEILDRRLYLGEVVWNRTEKRDTWGHLDSHGRPETEWIRTVDPALRLVSDEQWRAAHSRLESIRALRKVGTGCPGVRRRDVDSKYLLSGFARCATCGGAFGVMCGSHSSARGHRYGCVAYLKRGTSICGNGLRLPVDRVDDAVLQTLAGDVLRPDVVMAVVDGVFEALNPRELAREVDQLRSELEGIKRELTNLAKAIAAGGPLEALLVELKAGEALRDDLASTIAARQAIDVGQLNRKAIELSVHKRLDNWRGLLSSHVQDGRQLLREVLTGPLRFTPVQRSYRFEGRASIGALLAGTVGVATYVVAVRGFEPRSRG